MAATEEDLLIIQAEGGPGSAPADGAGRPEPPENDLAVVVDPIQSTAYRSWYEFMISKSTARPFLVILISSSGWPSGVII